MAAPLSPEELEEDYYDEDDLQDDEPYEPRRLKPEGLLALIAVLSAAVLITVAILSIPYFRKEEEDPEALLHSAHVEEETEPLTEETEPEETTVPTIPPEANPYGKLDFQYNRNNFLLCQKQDSYPGIDVSSFQGEIDWQQVHNYGVRFAIVRLGYRGYGAAGKLVEDEYARQNLEGAAAAGIEVGAYFFSQALNMQEVDEEIDFLSEILGETQLDMPLVLDWEIPPVENPRTANMDRDTLTECIRYFCDTMQARGYEPMVYFNPNMSRRLLTLHDLEDYPFWLAFYTDRMTYPFRVEMWQYSDKGRIPGINGDVDLDVYMPDLRDRQ